MTMIRRKLKENRESQELYGKQTVATRGLLGTRRYTAGQQDQNGPMTDFG